MAKKKKDNRGRKQVPVHLRKVPVRIFVQARYLSRAQADCAAIAAKYS